MRRALALVAAVTCGGCDVLFQVDKVEPDAVSDARKADASSYPISGLVASYTFDDVQPYRDVTGHGFDGTCVACPTLVTGKNGKGVMFDRTQRIGAPAMALPQFTIAAWLDAVPVEADECPFNKPYGTLNDDSWQLCLGITTSTTAVELYMSPATTLIKYVTLAAGWHHVAISFDGSTHAIAVDGTIVVTDQSTAPPIYDDSQMWIGTDIDSGDIAAPFAGTLDELKLFDRALGEKELAIVANTP